MIYKIHRVLKMIKISLSSSCAMKVANEYWQNTEITHGSMDEKQFDFYYNELRLLMLPSQNDNLLDYGGGNGEIAYRFAKDSFMIEHCDLSQQMVQNAISKFHLKSCVCSELKANKYNKILFHNAFFYIHPSLIDNFLINIYKKLENNGSLYITDTPDFDKRKYLNLGRAHRILSNFFPVYQIDLAGFFVKGNELEKKAKKIGFSDVIKMDSWGDYRTHWILVK